MKIIKGIVEMQGEAEERRKGGERIAFVPTMGSLHQGHRNLLKEGRRRGGLLVLSLFVNPTQFGPSEDFENYPRDWERDSKIAEEEGVDILFAPEASEMYPEGSQTTVHVDQVTKGLCGLSRPGHFDGVATVVAKLFNIVKPHVALFGEKDYQQLIMIRQMVRDLNFNIEIVAIPTAREEDGLAISSRNAYLTPDERRSALSLFRSLQKGFESFQKGNRQVGSLVGLIRRELSKEPKAEIDYIEIRDAETLEPISVIQRKAVAALAVRIGKTRLIDNILLS